MAEVINDAQQEFWRSPNVGEPISETAPPSGAQGAAEACADCCSEFMIGARFCHSCGLRRPEATPLNSNKAMAGLWARSLAWARIGGDFVAVSCSKFTVPGWVRYLHFHEIQRGIGLPTASLVSFLMGMGCVAGAIGVSLFYKASNLAEFDAIQMWRIQWLLAATASFVAGILLKKPSDTDRD